MPSPWLPPRCAFRDERWCCAAVRLFPVAPCILDNRSSRVKSVRIAKVWSILTPACVLAYMHPLLKRRFLILHHIRCILQSLPHHPLLTSNLNAPSQTRPTHVPTTHLHPPRNMLSFLDQHSQCPRPSVRQALIRRTGTRAPRRLQLARPFRVYRRVWRGLHHRNVLYGI